MKKFVLKLVRGIYRFLFKVEIEGLENIPTDKNFVVTPNHLSNFDPPLVAAFMPIDNMAYMAKASLFKVPVVAQVIRAFDAFPVKRGEGMAAIRTSIKLLKEGRCLVVFPEGKRVRTPGTLGKGKSGAVMIARFDDNDDASAKELFVEFKNNKLGAVRLEFYLLDESNDLNLTKEEFFTSENFNVRLKMENQTLYLIKLVKI